MGRGESARETIGKGNVLRSVSKSQYWVVGGRGGGEAVTHYTSRLKSPLIYHASFFPVSRYCLTLYLSDNFPYSPNHC